MLLANISEAGETFPQIVFKSPVWSGLLPYLDATATTTGFLLW